MGFTIPLSQRYSPRSPLRARPFDSIPGVGEGQVFATVLSTDWEVVAASAVPATKG
jgi:hypothetical protein